MPHEITMDENEKAAAVYAVKPAWHRLGEVTDALFAKDVLAQNGLDYGVETAPVYARVVVDGEERMIDVETHKMTYRTLDGKVVPLGVVGNGYVPVNPVVLFDFMDDVVGSVDGAHYCAGFALRNWKQIVCVADTGDFTLDAGGRADKIQRYVVGRTSHDGSLQFGLKWSNVRVECANMLAMHLKTNAVEWKTKHTTNVSNRVNEAKVALGMYREYGDEWAADAQTMIQAEIDAKAYDKWLDGLMLAVKKENDDDEVDREVMYAVRAIHDHSPQNAGIKGTVWGALNAATQFSDWALPTNGGKTNSEDEARFLRQIGDTNVKYGQPFKQTAWEWSGNFIQERIADTDKKRRSQVKVKAGKGA